MLELCAGIFKRYTYGCTICWGNISSAVGVATARARPHSGAQYRTVGIAILLDLRPTT